MFWFQGGPGANGIAYGLLTEHGPYYMDDSSLENETEAGVPNVYENPHSWDQVANMVWVTHPPGVGFSYCNSDPKTDACRWDDDTQAVAAHNLIKEFFDQFPEFENNDLYVTGESYGGMYVPTIVEQIHNRGEVKNLKGFAIGNGVIGHHDDYPGSAGSRAKFLHNKAFISEKLWEQIMDACGWDFSKTSSECTSLQRKASAEAGDYYIYNVYDRCEGNEVNGEKTWLMDTDSWEAKLEGDGWVGAPDDYPCGMEKLAVQWLNLPQVREALHVPQESFYGAPVALYPQGIWHYSGTRSHLLDVYPTLLKAYRGLIYNGDFDACVPYLGMEGWTRSLGFKVKSDWQPWTFNGQVAGYVTVYDYNDFTTATVKGAGHMVPTYKGRQALALISHFLKGEPLGGVGPKHAVV